jgi:DnaJ-class molecular chaperone
MTESYKTVCDTCGRKTWYDKEQRCRCEYPAAKTCESCGHTETIEPMRMEQCTGTLRLIVETDLDDRLTPYYERGERVEVREKDGTRRRFYVGKSTGWKPVYLEIARRNSSGGPAVYIPKGATIAGTGVYK